MGGASNTNLGRTSSRGPWSNTLLEDQTGEVDVLLPSAAEREEIAVGLRPRGEHAWSEGRYGTGDGLIECDVFGEHRAQAKVTPRNRRSVPT